MSDPIIHNPGNTKPLDELFAFVSVDSRGWEGICGVIAVDHTQPMQLVTGELRIAETMKSAANSIAARTGMRVRLVRFKRVDETLWESGGGSVA